MDYVRMAEWPGTPCLRKMRRAAGRLQNALEGDGKLELRLVEIDNLDEDERNARWLMLTNWTQEFSERMDAEITRLHAAEQINRAMDLAVLALGGNSPESIGMIVQRRPEGGPPDTENFAITALPRHPGWVGLNPMLEMCAGMEVHIHEQDGGPGWSWPPRSGSRATG